jgi:hypothetical protein
MTTNIAMNSESLALNPSMSINIGAESGEKKEMIATMMASAATVATEASSMELPIETNFMMAAASHKSLVNQSEKDIFADLDDDDTTDESSIQRTHRVQGGQEQEEREEHFIGALKDGLEFLARPRKSEKHIFFVRDYLLDVGEDDDDDNDVNSDDRHNDY